MKVLAMTYADAVKTMLLKLGVPAEGNDDCRVTVAMAPSPKVDSRGEKIREDEETRRRLTAQSVRECVPGCGSCPARQRLWGDGEG